VELPGPRRQPVGGVLDEPRRDRRRLTRAGSAAPRRGPLRTGVGASPRRIARTTVPEEKGRRVVPHTAPARMPHRIGHTAYPPDAGERSVPQSCSPAPPQGEPGERFAYATVPLRFCGPMRGQVAGVAGDRAAATRLHVNVFPPVNRGDRVLPRGRTLAASRPGSLITCSKTVTASGCACTVRWG
jgi:hypothetical protein